MLQELLECLGDVADPREPAKVEHRLVDVLAIAVCAVLAHAESFEDIALYGRSKRAWLGRFLELPWGIPSHDTFRRVLMLIDPEAFERGFLAWTRRAFITCDGDCGDEGLSQIAVDGKTLRRSFDRRKGRTPLHLVSAFATRSGLVLAQRRTANRGGEPAVLEELLAGLDVRGALISLDAASCHPGVAETITERGGDYLIALKGNRRALHAAVRAWFDAHAFSVGGGLWPCSDTWDDQHGRLVRRRVFVADAQELPDAAELVAAWPGLRCVVAVEAIRSVGNPAPGAPQGVRCQIRYYLTNSAAPEERVAAAVRAHWAIENRLHWVLGTGTGRGSLARARPQRRGQPRRAPAHRAQPRARRSLPHGQPQGQAQDGRLGRRLHAPPRGRVRSCVSPGADPTTQEGLMRGGMGRRRPSAVRRIAWSAAHGEVSRAVFESLPIHPATFPRPPTASLAAPLRGASAQPADAPGRRTIR